MRSILKGVILGTTYQAKVHDPTIVEGDCCQEQEVCVTAAHTLIQMHVTDWAKAQKRTHVEHSIGLADGTEKDRFEDNSGRTCLQ